MDSPGGPGGAGEGGVRSGFAWSRLNLDKKVRDPSNARMEHALLVGNTFPLSLIRRKVVIEPSDFRTLAGLLRQADIFSFWGHRNTLAHANRLAGADLSPRTERPTLTLDADLLPVLDGQVFRECWVVSPDYVPGYRPGPGELVPLEKITGWQVLRLVWED